MGLTKLEQGLLDHYQHYFPLTDRPFDKIAHHFGIRESKVLQQFKLLIKQGIISRIGPVFSAQSVGANVLVVMSVPAIDLDRVASIVSSFDEVTHCYEREHVFNLWFVVSADCTETLKLALSLIEQKAQYKLIALPMLLDYQVELGCKLNFGSPPELDNKNVVSLHTVRGSRISQFPATEVVQKALQVIQSGIPVCESPYDILGEKIGLTGRQLIGVIQLMHHHKILNRWGVVLRHYELGFKSNALVVWNVPTKKLDEVASKIAAVNSVSMCYKRPRSLPDWCYNLFTQVQGINSSSIEEGVNAVVQRVGMQGIEYEILFGGRRFKHPNSKLKPLGSTLLLASGGGHKKI